MSILHRAVAIGSIALVFSAIVLERAQAGGSHYYPPVTDPVVKEECGSCHLAFAPSMLPASSWQRMMRNLKNHFGDDASVEADIAAKIARHLMANAADAGGPLRRRKLLKGVDLQSAPQRITTLPEWVRKHRKVPDWEWRHQDVRTKANCVACHAAAERGIYDD